MAAEFKQEFEGERDGAVNWEAEIQPRIDDAIRKTFESVNYTDGASTHPSGQVLHNNSAWSLTSPNCAPSVGFYGIDIMMDEDYQPYVLEVQWAPDCDFTIRKVSEDNDRCFWGDVLGGLYLGLSCEGCYCEEI